MSLTDAQRRVDAWIAQFDEGYFDPLTNMARLSEEVGELARELPVSRPAVSQHLKVLKDAGLVIDRPAGTRRIYQLDADGIGALRAYLDQFWNQALTAFKAAVEQDPEEVS